MLDSEKRPLFSKVMRYFPEEYKNRYKHFLNGIYDLHAMNDKIIQLRDMLLTYGQMPISGHDQAWEILFSFKNHRWAHAYCGIYHGKKALIGSDLKPVFENYAAKKPKCVN
jgi:hypothetical protein